MGSTPHPCGSHPPSGRWGALSITVEAALLAEDGKRFLSLWRPPSPQRMGSAFHPYGGCPSWRRTGSASPGCKTNPFPLILTLIPLLCLDSPSLSIYTSTDHVPNMISRCTGDLVLMKLKGVESGVNPSTNEVTVEDAGKSRAKKHFIQDGLLWFIDIWKGRCERSAAYREKMATYAQYWEDIIAELEAETTA